MGKKKHYAKMFLDFSGKMVRNVLAMCYVHTLCERFTHSHTFPLFVLQVSATEECVGPMRLTKEPIQVGLFNNTVLLNCLEHILKD